MNKVQFTEEGFQKLKQEHQELLTVKRPYAVDRLQKARAMGDLSENSEYSAAKEDLAFVEGRIRELEELIKNAEIINQKTANGGIDIGHRVIVEFNNQQDEYVLVGEFEADPLAKKLSSTSPIGKALMGRKVGETVQVEVPAGKMLYKILDIQKE